MQVTQVMMASFGGLDCFDWHALHGCRPIADVVWCGEEDGLMQSVLLKVPFTIAITFEIRTKNKNVGELSFPSKKFRQRRWDRQIKIQMEARS